MAVKKKDEKAKAVDVQIREAIVKAVDELYLQHSGEIRELINESEDHKARINLGVDLDESESEPMVSVSIRFSSSITDKRICRLEDENQVLLFSSKEALQEASGETVEKSEELEVKE